MLRLCDIMTREVLTVDPDLSIRDGMQLLTSRHVGGAPVVAGMGVVGVVSLTDLVEFAASLPGAPTEQRRDSFFEESESTAGTEGDPEAIFFTEMWSDAGADTAVRFASTTGPEWNVLEEHTVSEAMTREVRSLPSGTGVLDAAAIMTAERIHRILVIDDGSLVGIVSLTDIARAAAEHRLSSRTYVFGHAVEFHDRGPLGARA